MTPATASAPSGMLRASIAALVLHAALLLGAARIAPQAPVPLLHKALAAHASLEIEVEVSSAGTAAAPAVPEARSSAAPASESRRHARVASLPRGHTTELGGELREPREHGQGGEPTSSGAPAEPGPSGSGPARPLAALGIGESSALMPRADARKSNPARAAARRVERSLATGLAEHDRAVGMGSGGPVLSALERAAYGSAIPGNTSALFVARIDERGRIAFLEVVDVNADRGGWSGIAKRALGSLRGKKLRVAAGAHGVELRIRVSSREVLPSGADPGLEVRALGIPLKKGRGKRSARVSILEPMARLDWVDVTLPDGENVRLPMLNVGVGVLGLAGDPSDIGAKPRRVVHARVESEKPL